MSKQNDEKEVSLRLEPRRSASFLFLNWDAYGYDEYIINKFGYVPGKGLAEYEVRPEDTTVTFELYDKKVSVGIPFINRFEIEVSKSIEIADNADKVTIHEFIDPKIVFEHQGEAVMIMPYAAPPPSPQITVLVTWETQNASLIIINGEKSEAVNGKTNEKKIEVDASNPTIRLEASASCQYYCMQEKRARL